MRLHQPWLLGTAALYIALAVVKLVAGHHDTSLTVLWLVTGVLWAGAAFRKPRSSGAAIDGPGPLRRTPATRFGTTGWPPSKHPDDYR